MMTKMISGMITWRLYLRAVSVAAIGMALFSSGCGVVADNHSPNGDKGLIASRQQKENNWDIIFLGVTGDLGVSSTDELVMNFEIGKDRLYATELLAKDCVNNITDIDINVTAPIRIPRNGAHDKLSLGYSLEKSMITGSNIWNAKANQMEFCQVVQLIIPANGSNPAMVITEDIGLITIKVDLSVDFKFKQKISEAGQEPRMSMIITAGLNVSIDGPISTFEERNSAIEKTITEVAKEGLKEGEELLNVKVLTIGGVAVRGRTHLGINGADLVELHQLRERKLQTETTVEYELVLEESCNNSTSCAELMDSTTMYEDLTTYMSKQIDNGGFTNTLQANAPDAEVTGGDFGEAELTLMEPADANFSFKYGSSNVNSYIEACQCDGATSFTCNTDIILPNDDLFLCVKSISSDVDVDFLESMSITQAVTTLGIIETNQVQFPSFTSREYVPGVNGVAVSTRLPSNLFSYGAGEFITITGVIVMDLAESDRKLLVATSDATFDKNAPFQFKVNIALGLNSAKSAANSANVFTVMGMIFSFIYTMLW